MAYWTKPNHTFVPEYQQSSLPFVTSSAPGEIGSTKDAVKIGFPGVTRWLEVKNLSGMTIRLGFTQNGVKGEGAVTGSNPISGKGGTNTAEMQADHSNYFLLMSGSSTGRWELKTSEIWLQHHEGTDADADAITLVAGITTVPNDMFVHLSGSAGFRGVG